MATLGFKEEKGYVHAAEEEQPTSIKTPVNEASKEDFI